MMKGKISLIETLKMLDSKQTISELHFVTADEQRNTGGEYIKLREVVQHGTYDGGGTYSQLNGISASDYHPNHWKNQTRNIKIISSGKLRKVNIHLIRRINGMEVL